MPKTLELLISQFPERAWNWKALSQNPALTWRTVSGLERDCWYWSSLSANPSISWQIIRENPEFPWNYSEIIKRSSLSFSEILEVFEKLPTDERKELPELSLNENITWQDVQEHPELPWSLDELRMNPAIRFEDLNSDSFPTGGWKIWFHSANPLLDWELIMQNSEISWNFATISMKNRLFTPEILREFRDRLDFRQLSWNSSITEELFLAEPQADWNLERLLFQTQDPGLIRRLVVDYKILDRFGASEKFLQEQFLDPIQRGEDWRLVAIVRALQNTASTLHFRFWKKSEYKSLNSLLDRREVVQNPESFDFWYLSFNQFQKYPDMIRQFLKICRKFFLILLSELRDTRWREEFQLALFPLRLRLEDILIRQVPNLRHPRLLL
jgi:hypothetical protein